jgi:signal-transduction protein with cAMP-binding, CBS, and nucleotidyltransferase domain
MTTTAYPHALDRPVHQVMRHGVVAVPDHLSLTAVRRAMADHQVHAILVQEHTTGRPLGWVRAEALLSWMNLESSSTHAHRAMTEAVIKIAPDAPLREAVAALSRHEVTHLLVCREGDVTGEGVLTALDIVGAWDR